MAPSRNFSVDGMKQLLKRQKKTDTAESPVSELDSRELGSTNRTENDAVSPLSVESKRDVSELGTESVDNIGSSVSGDSEAIGQTPINSDSHNNRVATTRNTSSSFVVPTRKFPLSSGFPYHQQLFNYGVSPDEWTRFTDDVTRVTTLSVLGQMAVWGTGVTVGLTTGTLLLIFGAPPGYYAGKAVYNKAIAKKVREGLSEDGELEGIMKFWNESLFAKKGCKVRLEMPNSKTDEGPNDEEAKGQDPAGEKKKKKERKKTKNFFKLVVEPLLEGGVSGLLQSPSELEDSKDAGFLELDDNGNPSTMYSMPPAYAPGGFISELEANPAPTAVESSARSIREMPATSKVVDGD